MEEIRDNDGNGNGNLESEENDEDFIQAIKGIKTSRMILN